MTGLLTPIPHTPLCERLRAEGRLREAEFSGNNTDDVVQFMPQRMSVTEMQRGYYQILDWLFAPGAMFERSRWLLDRLEPHIFHGSNTRPRDLRAALQSLWIQGAMRTSRRDYFRLLGKGWQRDAQQIRIARHALADVERQYAICPPRTRPRSSAGDARCIVALGPRARGDDSRRRRALARRGRRVGARRSVRVEDGTASIDDIQSITDGAVSIVSWCCGCIDFPARTS